MDINEGRMVDMHRLHMENLSWEEVKTIGVKPEALTNQTYIFINKKLYMLGGENSKEMSTNNLYILNLETLKWEKRIYLNLYFPEISGHSCIYYKSKNSLIVFGGFAKGMYLNSIYNLNLDINDWTKEEYNLGSVDLNLPEGRMCHSAIIAKDDMFIYAGFNVEKYFGDLWKFNLLSKEWSLIVPNNSEKPEPRIGNSFVYNENDNIIYIFGGKVANIQERNEFWKYDITNNLYELIHDTLLNQTNDIDNISNMPIKKAMSITKRKN
jgi:N-acetylneuraminic acid mutarotase